MKKIIILFIVLAELSVTKTIGQTPNLPVYAEKYDYYRERFNKYFIYVGPNAGESLPIVARDDGLLKTDDLPNVMGFYLGMLATEFKLTHDEGGNTDAVVRELYYALYALNRLDTYEAGIGNTARDGFMVREDFPVNFLTGPNNVHLTALNQGLPYPGDGELLAITSHNGFSLTPDDPDERAAMSMDHYSRLLLGLALVKKFASNITYSENNVTMVFQDGETSIQAEAIAIADRIITYMKDGFWFMWLPNSQQLPVLQAIPGFINDLVTQCMGLMGPWRFWTPLQNHVQIARL